MSARIDTTGSPTGGGKPPEGPRDRRSVTAKLGRLDTHREGARLVQQREADATIAVEARAKPGAIRARDKLFFFAQLAVMIDAGVPIAVALDGIARQADRLRLREVLREVLAEVQGGQALSAALSRHPKVFPETSVHLIRAGEASGNLPGMLNRVCRLMERDYEMKKKLKAALTYPMVMLSLAVLTVVCLFTFILPRFRGLYSGKEDKLPKPTKVIMAIGDFFAQYPWQIAGVSLAIVVGLVLYLRTPGGRSARDSFLLGLPILGGVIRKFSLARSVRTMGALLQSGVPVLTTLELARDLSSNQRLSDAWEYVRLRVANGQRIHEGMAGQSWFPGTLVQMTAMGESGGILDSVLVKVGEFYDQEAEAAVQESTAMLEPVMVIVVGCVVGFIAMAIMLPIFRMSSLVH